jgi:5-formyltetrahydrofolate cyclo-ligase
VTVGLAFSLQMLAEVPVDTWDVPVGVVVTEEDVIRVSREHPNGHFK